MQKFIIAILSIALITVSYLGFFEIKDTQKAIDNAKKGYELSLEALKDEYNSLFKSTRDTYNDALSQINGQLEERLGANNVSFVGGTVYNFNAGISSSATSITLASFTIPQTDTNLTMSHFGDIGYGTIEPGNTSRQEFISFTGVTQNANGTATLTGVTRGLQPFSPYTTDASYQFSHSGSSKFIISNPPQLYDEAVFGGNSETITGKWTFSTSAYPEASDSTTATTSEQFVTKRYVDNVSNQGAATSSESVAGISELATAIEVASSTQSTANNPFVIQAQNATSTPTTGCDGTATIGGLCIVVAENDGKINQLWLDLTDNYTVTGDWTFNDGTIAFNNGITNTATSTLSGNNIIEGFASTQTASTTITGSATPQPVYIATTTGALLLSDANDNSTYYQFDGFAISSGTNGETVYVQLEGVVGGFTGLTTGSEYYVSDTAGSISTTMGTNPIRVGKAISATQILIKHDKVGGTLISRTDNTTYEAYTDGNVIYSSNDGDGGATCLAYINGTEVMDEDSSGAAEGVASSMFIKRGDNWKVDCAVTNGDIVIRWQPYN